MMSADAIEADPDHLVIEQQLTANLDLATLKDSDAQQLTSVLFQLGRATTIDERKAVLKNAEIMNQGPKKSPLKTLAKRGHSLIQFLVSALPYRAFSSNITLDVGELVEFNIYCWGLLEPVLEGSLSELLYLSSDAPLPVGLDEDNLLDYPMDDILDHLRTQGARRDDWKVSTPVANCIIEAAQKAYHAAQLEGYHLGSPVTSYQTEWDAYVRMLPALFRTALRDSQKNEDHLWVRPFDKGVAASVSLKLRLILERQVWREALLMPSLAGPVPIFCSAVWTHFVSTWLPLKDVLYMVSRTFGPVI